LQRHVIGIATYYVGNVGLVLPVLSHMLQVYEMSPDAAKQAWQQQLLYTEAGSIVERGSAGVLALHQGSSTVRLQPDTDGCYELVATLDGGVVVSASCNGASKQAAAATANDADASKPAETQDAAVSEAAIEAAAAAARPVSGKVTPSTGKRPQSSGAAQAKAQEQQAAAEAAAAEAAAAEAAALAEEQASRKQEQCGEVTCMAASAASTALRVCTPQGLMVEVNTDGRVLLAPVDAPDAKVSARSCIPVLL
jgi:hypothetical protein